MSTTSRTTPWIGADGSFTKRGASWFTPSTATVLPASAQLRGVLSRRLLGNFTSGIGMQFTGTRPRRTASFEMGFAGYVEGTLSGVRQRRTSTYNLTAVTPGQFAGVTSRWTAVFQLLPGSSTDLTGVRTRRVGSFELSSWAMTSLAGARQRRLATVMVDVPPLATLAGVKRRLQAAMAAEVLQTANSSLTGILLRRTGSFEGTVSDTLYEVSMAGVRQRLQSSMHVQISNDSPEQIANAGNIVRWIFRDMVTGASVTVPINPREMSTPTSSRNMNWAWGAGPGAKMRGIDGVPQAPVEWTFSGVLLTKSHYDLLLDWTKRLNMLRITDHLGRTFEIIVQKFDPIERLPTPHREWRADYTMSCLLLKEVS